MNYSYFITSQVQRELDRPNHNMVVTRELSRLLDSHQAMQDKERRKHSKVYLQRPMTDGGPRLVFFKECNEELHQTIYVLRKAYENHNDYQRGFNSVDVKVWIDNHSYSEEEAAELKAEFERLSHKDGKDPLPRDYREYEVKRAFEQQHESMIFELPEWNASMEEVLADDWRILGEGISRIVDNPYTTGVQQEGSDFFSLYLPTIDYTITYRIEANGCHVYLLQVVHGKNANIKELIDKQYGNPNIAELRNFATKCYPSYFTIDYDAWKAIENDSEANLALSEEEVQTLQTIKYPFFVSGLAGSGKSTILYYLFANAYRHVVNEDLTDHDLLFLSYSRNLVENARGIVKSILCYHTSNGATDSEKEKMQNYLNDREKLARFNESFMPFQEFIRNSFLDVAERAMFPADNYIGYKEFKARYEKDCQLREKSKFSPDIVWSVIRTYIKGRGLEDFTDQDYRGGALVNKDRSVTNEDFRDIYKIYKSWYCHIYENGEGWDDLDLVRYALKKQDRDQVFHHYAVVFCDEAQDFTKLETDLILRLSVHSQYDLSQNEESQRIPIAFAGDPNQTINPTGFRWGSTQDIFNNSFKEALGKFQGFKPNILRRNYRSLEGIVKFANTLQSIRHQHFHDGTEGRNLQMVRSGGEEVMKTADTHSYIAYYSLDEHAEAIAANLNHAIIITPDEGEHSGLDAFLQKAQDRLEEKQQLKLHTAISSKGLEFKAIMLYKFGCDKAASIFQKIVNGKEITDASERYELSHFFTKLYIAVSRAKRVLYIVDTKEGYDTFWKYFVEEDLWKQVISRLNLTEKDRNLVGYVSTGEITAMSVRLRENYNPKEYALTLFQKALTDENSDTMRAALSAFREAQMGKRSDECEAYIELFDRHFEKAGDLFLKMCEYDKAVDAYWNGKCWKKVIEATDMSNSEVANVRRQIARFMSGSIKVADFIAKWKEQESLFQDYVRSAREKDLWCAIFDRLQKECSGLKPVDISASLVQNLDDLADYAEWYDQGFITTRAMLHYHRASFVNRTCKNNPTSEDFKREDYQVAIELWDECGLTQSKEYYTSRKLLSTNPADEIIWMDKLGENADIVAKYGDPQKSILIGASGQNIVFSSLLGIDYEKAANYPYPTDKKLRWARLYEKDPVRFLNYVVLPDFTMDKFFYVAEKVHDGDDKIFASPLPSLMYETIFRLKGTDADGKPFWSYFQSDLKDSDGYCVLRNAEQINPQLDALSAILKENMDHKLASCFLEILFGKQYNARRAEKYVSTLKLIFDSGNFIREDFRIAMRLNLYYSNYSKITVEALDSMKDNVRKFVREYFDNRKKVQGIEETIKSLGHAFETCISYVGTEPEFRRIIEFYAHFVKEKAFAPMKDWLLYKVNLYQILEKGRNGNASFENLKTSLKNKELDLAVMMETLNREEACALIVAVNMSSIPCVPEAGFYTAKLMYKFDLRAEDFKMFCKVDKLRPNIDKAVKDSIEWYLDRSRIDEYALKILAFSWENLYGHTDIASRYEDLIYRSRLAKLPCLVEYFMKRALLHYSYLKQNLFEEKQLTFGIQMSKDYLPSRHPEITEKNSNSSKEEKSEEKPAATKTRTRSKKEPSAKAKTLKSGADVATAVTIAKNLKTMGLSVEQISTATGLSVEEISKI